MSEDRPVLDVQDLHVHFAIRGKSGLVARAVDGVSLRIGRGETLGLVGESGSGKSTIGNAVLGLVPTAGGRVVVDGEDLSGERSPQRRAKLGRMQVVFQDPFGSLNPRRTVGQTLAESLLAHPGTTRRQVEARVTEVLDWVHLPANSRHRYPTQFSGGQRQRIAIARALIPSPRLIICDEPTSALDLSVQAQILNLLMELQKSLGLSYLFVSHDIDVVRHVSDRVAVLYRGKVVEEGDVRAVTEHPQHPYTKRLLSAAPVPDPAVQLQRRLAAGAERRDPSVRIEGKG